ncbi:MAG: hypothetical protein LBQ77_00090 [Treponema sp.]|jgi:hypothetical protein|nr:hypothetical protein [Treponema sp.]
MKKILLTLTELMMVSILFADPVMREQFNGDWMSDDVRFVINDQTVEQYQIDENGDWKRAPKPDQGYFVYAGNNLAFLELGNESDSTQTQNLSFSIIDEDTLSLVQYVNKEDPVEMVLSQWNPEFNNTWVGVITFNDEENTPKTLPIKVTVYDRKVTHYFNNNGTYEPEISTNFRTAYKQGTIVYSWINSEQTNAWSETEIFSLFFVDQQTVDVTWIRHMNYHNTTEGRNRVQSFTGTGILHPEQRD